MVPSLVRGPKIQQGVWPKNKKRMKAKMSGKTREGEKCTHRRTEITHRYRDGDGVPGAEEGPRERHTDRKSVV